MENEKFFVSLSLFFSFLSHRIDGAATGAATREARAAAAARAGTTREAARRAETAGMLERLFGREGSD